MVTGATGRLGCGVVERLEEFGIRVYPIVLPGYSLSPKRIKWGCNTKPIAVNGLRDLQNLAEPDYVINLHWHIDRTLSFAQQILFELDYNIHRLEFFWDWLASKIIKRFVNVSSIKVFSNLNSNPITVDSEPRPMTPYGIAKKAAESFFDARFYNSGFPVAHLRLCSVASYGEHPSHLMSQLMASGFEKERIKVNTGHYSNLLYIEDAIDLIINSAFVAENKYYNLTTDGIKNETIACEFERITNSKLNADFVDLMPGIVDPVFISDIPKLRSEWTRKTTLQKIIQKLVEQRNMEMISQR
jgi:nucleoside-diphosphate-sugar epimerase